MRRLLLIAALALTAGAVIAPVAQAGSPHFVNNAFSITRSGDSLIVSGKEAGLGDELQVDILVEAEAACINPGQKHPRAANKESFSAEGTFPVQNGKADFTLTLTATFSPSCSPPMTVVFTNVTVTDLTNDISRSFSGTF